MEFKGKTQAGISFSALPQITLLQEYFKYAWEILQVLVFRDGMYEVSEQFH